MLTSSINERKNYGWTVVGVGIVIGCIGMGSMMSLSIFLQPMAEAMGWTRAGISTAALFNFLAMGVGSFLWGALSDRFGTRVVVTSGGALLGLGLVSASQAATLLQFQFLFGILVGLSVGALYTPLISGTMRWFSRNRSLAVALVSSGLSLGSTVVGPIARGLITAYDWRIAMLVVGNLAWLVIIPLALFLRDPGTDTEGEQAAAGADASPTLTVGEALRTPQFAAIALAHFACCAAHSGPIFHMASNAMDHGVSAMAAATVFSLAGVGSLIGRVICGLLADRIGAKRMLLIGLTLQASPISLYMVTDGLAGFYALALMFGFSYGGVMPLYAIVVREYFGARIMGTTFGAVGLIATLGMALGPLTGGLLYDTLGSYFWLYMGSFGIGLGAVAIALTFRPPRAARALVPAPSAGG